MSCDDVNYNSIRRGGLQISLFIFIDEPFKYCSVGIAPALPVLSTGDSCVARWLTGGEDRWFMIREHG